MSLTGRLLTYPRCEVLVFLPLSFVHRFVGRDGQEDALTALFGCEDWREAISLQGEERRAFLLELFERQLAANPTVAHVRSFQLRTQDGNDYRLVFGVGHDKGLDFAKDAMWKVDPIAGTSYVATVETGQEVLFSAVVDTSALLGGAALQVRQRLVYDRRGRAPHAHRHTVSRSAPAPEDAAARREGRTSRDPACRRYPRP